MDIFYKSDKENIPTTIASDRKAEERINKIASLKSFYLPIGKGSFKGSLMSKFNKMNRQQKRSSRLLALQLMYANEITDTNNTKFLKEIFDIKSSINGSSDKHEVLSNLDISSEMALSILPESIKEKYLETIKSFDDKNLDHISNSIISFNQS